MRSTNRKRHRPEKVVPKLRQANEAPAKGRSRRSRGRWVSEVTLHRWRAEYGTVDRDAVKQMKDLEKDNARLTWLVLDQQLGSWTCRSYRRLPSRNSEPGAAELGDRAREDGDVRVRAAGVPSGGPAPRHAAPSGTAEPLPGPAGGADAVARLRTPTPWLPPRHGFAPQAVLDDRHAAHEVPLAYGGPAGAADAPQAQTDRDG